MENKNWTINVNKLFNLIRDDLEINSSMFARVREHMTRATTHTQFVNGQCTNCCWFGDSVETQYYNYCPSCGSYVVGDEDD